MLLPIILDLDTRSWKCLIYICSCSKVWDQICLILDLHQCLAEIVSGNSTVAGAVLNCTGREGKQLISQVIIFPRDLSMVLRSSRSYSSVSSLLFGLLQLITEKFHLEGLNLKLKLLKRLFTTLVVSTPAPLSSRPREFLPLCIDLAAPERLKVSSPLGSFLVLWGVLENVSAPKVFYSPSQKLQEGGASWDSCACSRHSCLLDRGLKNRLKLECNRLKRNTTDGSCRLTDNPLLQVSADLQRVAAISNHLISTMASYLRWEPEPQVNFSWKS